MKKIEEILEELNAYTYDVEEQEIILRDYINLIIDEVAYVACSRGRQEALKVKGDI